MQHPDSVRLLEAREAIYESALDPCLWPNALSLLGSVVGAHSGCISAPTYEAELGLVESGFAWGVDLERADHFARNCGELDPWSKAIAAKGLHVPGQSVVGSDLCDERALKHGPWWEGYFKPFGNGDLLAMFCRPPPGSSALVASLALHRGPGEAPFTHHDALSLEALRPDIERAMRASLALASAKRQLGLARETLDALSAGVFLVDVNGAVIEANAAGERLLACGAPVKLSQGALAMADAAHDDLLRALIAQAAKCGRGGEAIVADDVRGRFAVTVTPLSRARFDVPRALVMVANTLSHVAEGAEPLRHRFGLTQAEIEIAALLAQGRSVAAISAARGVARETTRGQLKSLFDKLGVRSQVAAAALIATTLSLGLPGPD